ncbi:MAG: THUMP domain-containing protein [Candidatus Woesearchaeota archaeon]
MKSAVFTEQGVEEFTALEIKEILKKPSIITEKVVFFEADANEICTLAYNAHSALNVIGVIGECSVNNNLEESIVSIKQILNTNAVSAIKGKTFRVNCIREGAHDYSSQDIASGVGEIIAQLVGSKVSLVQPDCVVLVYINNSRCLTGIDFAGFDLSKRDYKVFSHPSTLSAITAYSLMRFSGYKKNGVLLDPFCGAGTIPIEAALFATGISPHFFKKEKFICKIPKDKRITPISKESIIGYDNQLRFITSSRKNAAIAGVDKYITFSKVDVEWLDTKISKGSVDKLVTHPPSPSKTTGEKELQNLYREFFYQADFVLTKDGIIAVCLQNSMLLKKMLLESENFLLVSEKSVWQGKQKFDFLRIKRKNN